MSMADTLEVRGELTAEWEDLVRALGERGPEVVRGTLVGLGQCHGITRQIAGGMAWWLRDRVAGAPTGVNEATVTRYRAFLVKVGHPPAADEAVRLNRATGSGSSVGRARA